MKNWFTVKVKYNKQLEDGTLKKVSEQYLLSAISFTDAEAKTITEIGSFVRGEFVIDAINKTEISDVFRFEETQSWYLVRAEYESMDVKGGEKSKKITQKFIVSANNIDEAQKNIKNSLSGMMVDFDITSITESAIKEVFLEIETINH